MHLLYHSYEDMRKGMDIIQLRIKSYEKQKKLMKSLLETKTDSSLQGEDQHISHKRLVEELGRIESHLLLHHEELSRLHNDKKRVDMMMGQLEGVNEQVFYYRTIKGLTQEETAEKVYLSTRQVQRIERRIEQEIMSC